MPKIHELPAHVADLIAAGEVVERPASVIKELIENAFDAGASTVTVEINAGGMTFMRVTDDGCGISPDDAEIAFRRHATSKLQNAEGLEAIGTLGFRGEALCAIAAVSRIELLTRTPGAETGVSLTLEAGNIVERASVGCPEGTTIIVRDLFFNTPARHKFMKSDRAEGAATASAALRCALGRPEISVRFIKDGKAEFHTPGDSRADSCIYSLFGAEFAKGLLETEASDENVKAYGYVSTPDAARGNRNYQFFFVNGRHIRSKTLQAALETAYANALPGGRFPACVLYITVNPGDVDVNVHPAKTEVKFALEKQVFNCVRYAAMGAMGHSFKTDAAPVEPGPAPDAESFSAAPVFRDRPATSGSSSDFGESGFRKSYGSGGFKTSVPFDKERGVHATVRDETVSEYSTKFASDGAFDPSPVVIGEAMQTYVLAEYRGSLWLIDKHAAHERIHFDALSGGSFEPMAQALIEPIICRHGFEDAQLLLENAALLDELGFTVDRMGEGVVAVRRIPSDIDLGDAEPALSEICAHLAHGSETGPSRLDSIFRTIACKAAIKAGKSSDKRELEVLARRVLSGEVSRCPHGRPIAVEFTKESLDRRFRRI